jgi:hypothetical protein
MRKDNEFLRDQLAYLENENAEQMKLINALQHKEEQYKERIEGLED